MEPLHPDLRAALKEAHPGLTDEIIDQHEALLVQRFMIDPDQHPAEIRELDRRRELILQQHMPRYREVFQMYEAKRAQSRHP